MVEYLAKAAILEIPLILARTVQRRIDCPTFIAGFLAGMFFPFVAVLWAIDLCLDATTIIRELARRLLPKAE